MWLLLISIVLKILKLSNGSDPYNVLFLIADDMRPNIEALRSDSINGFISPTMHTPNFDKLARKSLVLKQAYVQQAICAPSRASVLTGRRPDTTHVYGFSEYWRRSGGNFTTIPQYFKESGYTSIGIGKVFHPHVSSNNNDPISWSVPYFDGKANFESMDKIWAAIPDGKLTDSPLIDEQIADEAIRRLREHAENKNQPGSQPLFLAVGFHKPHLPFVFPESMFEYYPESSIRLPSNPYAPTDMPRIAWNNNHIFRSYRDLRKLNVKSGINDTAPDSVTLELRRAYYCALSWTDLQLGRVLDELDRLGMSDNTIISFWGDHGYHLGEHDQWTKFSNFELALKAPMMMHIPGVTTEMTETLQVTEFVDLFPTLVEAAGLEPLPLCPEDSSEVKLCREGLSLLSLLDNPDVPLKKGAFSQCKRKGGRVMGYSVRTSRYRYTEWVNFSQAPDYKPIWEERIGEELYDHFVDPEENHNNAKNREYGIIKSRMEKLLHEGWRNAIYDEEDSSFERNLIDRELSCLDSPGSCN